MRKFKGYVATAKIGSRCEFEFETEDDCAENEIEEEARDAAFQFVEWNYEEVSAR